MVAVLRSSTAVFRRTNSMKETAIQTIKQIPKPKRATIIVVELLLQRAAAVPKVADAKRAARAKKERMAKNHKVSKTKKQTISC